jgi:hypothetical protein
MHIGEEGIENLFMNMMQKKRLTGHKSKDTFPLLFIWE